MAPKSNAFNTTELTIPGDQMAVRMGLRALFDTLLLRTLSEDGRGTAEIVLAEVLNNIVEHAYTSDTGEIEIKLRLSRNQLVCRITDSGRPMPEGQIPAGVLATINSSDPPEGGFGWHLIRTLSKDLCYRRVDGRNLLSFRLDTQQLSH